MAVTFHFLNASKRLTQFEPLIQQGLAEARDLVIAKIPIPDVDIVVADVEHLAVAETGVGGMTHSAHLIEMYIDATHPELNKKIQEEVRSTLTHELHHAARRYVIGYESSLLGTCVSEGLADHFDIEVNGLVPKAWSVSTQGEVLERLIEIAKPVFSEDFDHNEWFWGVSDKPKWAVYAIGFELVRRYMEKTGKKPSELVAEETELFA